MTNTNLTINFTNEKGNARPAVRTAVKAQVVDYLIKSTDGKLMSGPNGLFMQVATDEATGAPIYAVVNLSITTHDPMVAKPKASKVAAEPAPVVANLFE